MKSIITKVIEFTIIFAFALLTSSIDSIVDIGLRSVGL